VGQHALAGSGRTDEEEAMGAGRGDLERAAGFALSADVREIGIRGVGEGWEAALLFRQPAVAPQMSDDLGEVGGRNDLGVGDALGFGEVAARQDHRMTFECRLADGRRMPRTGRSSPPSDSSP
jgi:hypothetical protein